MEGLKTEHGPKTGWEKMKNGVRALSVLLSVYGATAEKAHADGHMVSSEETSIVEAQNVFGEDMVGKLMEGRIEFSDIRDMQESLDNAIEDIALDGGYSKAEVLDELSENEIFQEVNVLLDHARNAATHQMEVDISKLQVALSALTIKTKMDALAKEQEIDPYAEGQMVDNVESSPKTAAELEADIDRLTDELAKLLQEN
jgi:hypothetical protein